MPPENSLPKTKLTYREQVRLAVVKVGIRIALQEMIHLVQVAQDTNNEAYLATLKSDLLTALNHYENRYAEETPKVPKKG